MELIGKKILKDLVDRKIGYGIVQPGQNVDNGIPVIKVNNIISGLSDVNLLDKTTVENSNKYKRTLLQGGELLISLVGSVGKTAIVPKSFSGCNLVRATGLIDIKNPLICKWTKYFIDSKYGQTYINNNLNTTVQPTLNIDSLEKMEIPFFQKEYMEKAVNILHSLDDKIELNNKINTNLEHQAQALFKNWFVDKYEKEGTIGDYCSVKSGFAFKSSWWQDEGTKVIRIGDIEQGCLNLETCAHVADDKIEVAKDFIVQGGDLVIAMTGATIGKFSMIPKTQEPILVNQRVGKFFLGNNPIEKVPFIYCTLKQEEVITEFINRGQGSAQPNISTGDILSVPCWIPSKNEIDDFNKTIQPMFETIISNQEENRKLSDLRDSLLPKLMNGEIFDIK